MEFSGVQCAVTVAAVPPAADQCNSGGLPHPPFPSYCNVKLYRTDRIRAEAAAAERAKGDSKEVCARANQRIPLLPSAKWCSRAGAIRCSTTTTTVCSNPPNKPPYELCDRPTPRIERHLKAQRIRHSIGPRDRLETAPVRYGDKARSFKCNNTEGGSS